MTDKAVTTPRKGGARRKSTHGLSKVLYVRADEELIERLEALRARRSRENRGVVLTTSDLARSILWEALERSEEDV
jgi:hypothetical protein